MRIPEIQRRLREIAKEASDLADDLSRRKPKKRAPRTSTPMDDRLRHEIKQAAESNPDLPLNRIASAFDVNPGRVSEIVSGFRS